ncbi:MAG: hypothetical protein MHPSP_002735 [Paramarteilia canceri]
MAYFSNQHQDADLESGSNFFEGELQIEKLSKAVKDEEKNIAKLEQNEIKLKNEIAEKEQRCSEISSELLNYDAEYNNICEMNAQLTKSIDAIQRIAKDLNRQFEKDNKNWTEEKNKLQEIMNGNLKTIEIKLNGLNSEDKKNKIAKFVEKKKSLYKILLNILGDKAEKSTLLKNLTKSKFSALNFDSAESLCSLIVQELINSKIKKQTHHDNSEKTGHIEENASSRNNSDQISPEEILTKYETDQKMSSVLENEFVSNKSVIEIEDQENLSDCFKKPNISKFEKTNGGSDEFMNHLNFDLNLFDEVGCKDEIPQKSITNTNNESNNSFDGFNFSLDEINIMPDIVEQSKQGSFDSMKLF